MEPLGLAHIALAFAVAALAGFVKGAIGFAMPMIMMSALTAFLPPSVALALLILPTFATNITQAFRQGAAAAIDSAHIFRLHIGAVLISLALSAQFVVQIPKAPLEAALGLPILGFALWQLSVRPMTIRIEHRARAEVALGVIGGLYGGISGIWGPPLIVLLLSLGTPKAEAMRVQGVVFLIGSTGLFAAHLASGILNGQTLPVSALLVVPALIGNRIGQILHDRLDGPRFRNWTLVLLAVTGANLVRQALS